jgi:hypothetical protein
MLQHISRLSDLIAPEPVESDSTPRKIQAARTMPPDLHKSAQLEFSLLLLFS